MLLTISLSLLEIAVLFFGALILGVAFYFFIKTRRSLQETVKRSNASLFNRRTVVVEEQRPAPVREPERQKVFSAPEIPAAKQRAAKEESVEHLKETILQQQKLLNGFLKQVEEIENEGKDELTLENKHLREEVRDLEARLEKKNEEVESVKQQALMAERMSAKIEEVYQEIEQLQAKMVGLEKQANRANNLALELEDTRQAYEQIHKDLQRKTEKLDEAFLETHRMQQELNTMEDKLAEANLQRQQLQKKVQFMQDLNTDLQSVSDTNKKLQTELRRIGELESMLNMIAEERDYLLRKRS